MSALMSAVFEIRCTIHVRGRGDGESIGYVSSTLLLRDSMGDRGEDLGLQGIDHVVL